MEGSEGVRVRRPARLPYALARLSRERGIGPLALLTEAIEGHPTYQEAADYLGIDTTTLRQWRKRFQIEVEA